MAIIWLRPQASYREGMINMSAPAYTRRASPSLNRMLTETLPGCCHASSRSALAYSSSPVPTTTSCTCSSINSSMICITRSSPLASTRRVIMPTTGISRFTVSPSSRCRASLARGFFTSTLDASKRTGICGSVSGLYSCSSRPFKIPLIFPAHSAT